MCKLLTLLNKGSTDISYKDSTTTGKPGSSCDGVFKYLVEEISKTV